jgi:hypothetical protein
MDDAPLPFTSGSGFDITLTSATLHLGAVYLNASKPSSGGPEEPCILPGVYVGQAFANVDVDLLSSTLTTFTTTGAGTANPAAVGEVWLTGSGDINADEDPTPILQIAGTATRMGDSWPFTSTVTIGSNRAIPPPNPAMPGANAICRQRIVSPICGAPTATDSCPPLIAMLTDGGTLDLRIDPRPMFDSVDFTTLAANGSSATVTIPDTSAGTGGELYGGMRSSSNDPVDSVYRFTWTDKGP